MKTWYYGIEATGERKGPLTKDEIGALIQSGIIQHRTLIWQKGMTNWIAAGDQDEITSLFPTEEPPPMPMPKSDEPPLMPTSKSSQPPTPNSNSVDVSATPTEEELRCPKCNSLKIEYDKKKFKVGRAIGVGILLGPLGLLAGLTGNKDIVFTCLKCGNRWSPGQDEKSITERLKARSACDKERKQHAEDEQRILAEKWQEADSYLKLLPMEVNERIRLLCAPLTQNDISNDIMLIDTKSSLHNYIPKDRNVYAAINLLAFLKNIDIVFLEIGIMVKDGLSAKPILVGWKAISENPIVSGSGGEMTFGGHTLYTKNDKFNKAILDIITKIKEVLLLCASHSSEDIKAILRQEAEGLKKKEAENEERNAQWKTKVDAIIELCKPLSVNDKANGINLVPVMVLKDGRKLVSFRLNAFTRVFSMAIYDKGIYVFDGFSSQTKPPVLTDWCAIVDHSVVLNGKEMTFGGSTYNTGNEKFNTVITNVLNKIKECLQTKA